MFGLIDGLFWLPIRACRLLGLTRRPEPFTDPQSILLVQLDHLGDAILSTGLLDALSRRYPRAKIEVLTSPRNTELFESCSHVHAVHVVQVNRFSCRGELAWMSALLLWAWRLRRRRFDMAIDARGDFSNAVLIWLAGARRRVGWTSGGGDFLLTDAARYVADRHEAESRQALLDLLGIAPPAGHRAWPPVFEPSHAARAWIEHEWPSATRSGRPLVVVHVSAGTPAKRWPAEHFRDLIQRLVSEFDAQIALVGTGDDWLIARQIIGSRNWPDVWNLTGLFNLAQLGALMERAALVIGADSGPVHLAAAVGTPVVAVFSGTNEETLWRPYGQRVTVVLNHVPCSPCYHSECPLSGHACMQGLSPRAVFSAAREFLTPLVSDSHVLQEVA